MKEQIKQELMSLIKKTPYRGVKVSVRSKPHFVELLNELYPHLDISEQIYLFGSNKDSVPLAPCGATAKFESVNVGYKYHCHKSVFGKDKCVKCAEMMTLKKAETNLKTYGVDNPAKLHENTLKSKKTNKERYGNEIAQRSDEVKQKSKETHAKLYKEGHSSRTDSVKRRTKNTVMEKYGVKSALLINKKSLDERFDEFKNKNEPNFTLLSTKDEYNKNEYSSKAIYKWKCNTCSNEFYKVEPCLRCLRCNPYSNSTGEKELCEFLDSMNITYEKNNRTLIYPYEIDIFIPSLGIGLEYNGDYWHNTSRRPDILYHQNKTINMNNLGYKLITIFETDMLNKESIVKNRLIHILNNNKTTIYARKCVVRVVTHREASDFLNEHHIQGSCSSKIRYGLYYNDELVQIMTFGTPRFNKKYQYELLRLCSKFNVVGGASKLLKHFEKTINPDSLISYADMKWSNGNVYDKLNFIKVRVSKPSYFYSDGKDTFSRYECQKKKLLKRYNMTDTNQTEHEIMTKMGYYRVYDCGTIVYEKKYR